MTYSASFGSAQQRTCRM